jgi:hypothetical protein
VGAPFASSARRSGASSWPSGRIPIQAMVAAIEADEEADDPEGA